MPIYEYQCSECAHQLDKLQKMNDQPLTDCPNCGKPGLVKQVSAPSFQLKGDGWYVTDFRGQNKKTVVDDKATTKSDSCTGASTCGDAATTSSAVDKSSSKDS